jgi:hypothetical protein
MSQWSTFGLTSLFHISAHNASESHAGSSVSVIHSIVGVASKVEREINVRLTGVLLLHLPQVATHYFPPSCALFLVLLYLTLTMATLDKADDPELGSTEKTSPVVSSRDVDLSEGETVTERWLKYLFLFQIQL